MENMVGYIGLFIKVKALAFELTFTTKYDLKSF